MAETTNLEELQRLYAKMSGKQSKAENIAEAIAEITSAYKNGGGSGGSGVSVVSAYLYPNSGNMIKDGVINLSDGTTIDIDLMYIPEFDVESSEGSTAGTTKLTTDNVLSSGHSYRYAFDLSPAKPAINEDMSSYEVWDGASDIEAEDGVTISLIEVNEKNKAVKVGITSAVIKY